MNTQRYRPSNGTEGDIFAAQFCDRCVKRGSPDEGTLTCSIEGRAFFNDVLDVDYPDEWIEDANVPYPNTNPRCTAFRDKALSLEPELIHDERQIGFGF